MCRLYGFQSSVLSGVHQSLVAAENALGQQSQKHRDGWGVAYYVGPYPHLVRSEKQAIEDKLFKDVSAVVSTNTLIAHIRLATAGPVHVLNCHPFQHGNWTFAHNGRIANFADDPDVQNRILKLVDPRFARYILGQTDSELLFYIFLSRLARRAEDLYNPGTPHDVVLAALQEMLTAVLAVAPDDEKEDNCLSFLISNGHLTLGFRLKKELFFSTHKTKCPERSICPSYETIKCEQPVRSGLVKHLAITSEAISEGPNVWEELADGDYVLVDHAMNFHQGSLLPDNRPSPLKIVNQDRTCA